MFIPNVAYILNLSKPEKVFNNIVHESKNIK